MDLIDRIDVFLSSLVTTLIVLVVVVLVLRIIANYADWNFFGWPAVTIRRLTDPLIRPVRQGLLALGVDPKYAPLATILMTILVLWLAGKVTGSILGTVGAVIIEIQRRSVSHALGQLLYGLLGLYTLMIFARIVFSWVRVSYANRFMRFLINTTEPLLGPLRRRIPPVGMFDISPFVAFVIVWVFRAAVAGTLLRN